MIYICLLSLSSTSLGQQVMKLKEAVEISLKQNHDIQIAGLDTIISGNNATAGNAGLLPKVYLTGSYDYMENNTEAEILSLNNGSSKIIPIDIDAAENTKVQAAVKLEYVLFDGLGSYYKFRMLNNQDEVTRLQMKNLIENSVLNTVFLYLNVAVEQASLDVTKEHISISAERYKRAIANFKFGIGNRTNLLQAEVDLKNDSILLRQNQLSYNLAKNDLNVHMGRSPNLNFKVDELIEFTPIESKEYLTNMVLNENTLLKMMQYNTDIANNQLEMSKSSRYPKLVLNGGYNYSDEENDAGINRSLQLDGWNVGVGLRFNIFDGKQISRNIQNSKIALQQSIIRKDKIKLEVLGDFENSYLEYNKVYKDWIIDQENLKMFEQNYVRSEIDFENGQISNIQLRDAQFDLSNAKFRIIKSKYNVKKIETKLLQLTGSLIRGLN